MFVNSTMQMKPFKILSKSRFNSAKNGVRKNVLLATKSSRGSDQLAASIQKSDMLSGPKSALNRQNKFLFGCGK